MSQPTLPAELLPLAQQLAQRLHTHPIEASRRALLLLQFLLDQQEQGSCTTIQEADPQQTVRKLVITHYSNGYLDVHADRLVL